MVSPSATERVLESARKLPEGTPLTAKELLHLGSRASIDQALSRLVRGGALIRVSRGIYVIPVRSRFGTRPPSPPEVVQALARQRGETVASSPAEAANKLGLTTQVPVRETYLTSGRSRTLQLGRQVVSLAHAPRWQLLFPNEPAGEAVRALVWLGRREAPNRISRLASNLSAGEIERLASARQLMPTWVATTVSSLLTRA
jgi:hypothetical protein